MNKTRKEIMNLLIDKAKKKVIKAYEGREYSDRAWLETHVDSYKEDRHRIQLIVLEGSPVKGYVIVNYGRGLVRAYSCHDKCIFSRLLETEVMKWNR